MPPGRRVSKVLMSDFKAEHKGVVGKITVMSDRLLWMPESQDASSVSILFADVKERQRGGRTKAEICLQLRADEIYIFRMKAVGQDLALEQREAIKDLIDQRLSSCDTGARWYRPSPSSRVYSNLHPSISEPPQACQGSGVIADTLPRKSRHKISHNQNGRRSSLNKEQQELLSSRQSESIGQSDEDKRKLEDSSSLKSRRICSCLCCVKSPVDE